MATMQVEEMNSSSRVAGSKMIHKVYGNGGGGGVGGCPIHVVDWYGVVSWQSVLLAILAVLALSSYVGIYRWLRRDRPGPSTWPLVGSVPILIKNWSRVYDFLLEFFEKGPDAIWVYSAFGVESVYLAAPQLLEHVLKNNFVNYPKGYTVVKHMEELLGKGIFNSDNESWRVQRKVSSFEFSSANLRDLSTGVYKECAVTLVRTISEFVAQSSRPIEMQDLILRMTLDSTAKLGFGVELGCLSTSLPEIPFAAAFDRASELSFHRYIDPLWNLKRFLNLGREKELKGCLEIMDSFCYNVINRRRDELTASKLLGKTKLQQKPDLLSRFMTLTAGSGTDEFYSDEELRDIVLNFILAGRDTTGVTICWFLYRLCLDPEIARKLFEEIQTLEQEASPLKETRECADKYTQFAELLTYQNLGQMHYLHAAISETLRLYPPIPLDGKTAADDDVLPDGTEIRKGSMVIYSSYVMGRLERIWGPDAKEFKPERWLKNGIFQAESPFKFITFHAGPRSCLGKDSAYLQSKMTAALLVRFFKFRLAPESDVGYRLMFVLSMRKPGLKVMITPR